MPASKHFADNGRRRRNFLYTACRRGNSQAKELLKDGTLESFSLDENTKGEAFLGKSLRFKDRGGAYVPLCFFVFFFQ